LKSGHKKGFLEVFDKKGGFDRLYNKTTNINRTSNQQEATSSLLYPVCGMQ
jgi:hypothetical protein